MVNCALCESDASVAPLEVGGWNFAVHASVRFQCGHFVHEACWGRHLFGDLSKSLTCPTCAVAVFTPGDMPTFDASWRRQEDCLSVSSEPLADSYTYVAAALTLASSRDEAVRIA